MREMEQKSSQLQIAVLLTCFNRKKHTLRCIQSLQLGNPEIRFHFVITDAASTDGTKEAVLALDADISLLDGNNHMFWNGGMIQSITYALEKCETCAYVMLVNDDVSFFPGIASQLLERLEQEGADVIVGATRDHNGHTSYGGVRMLSKHFARFALIEPTRKVIECDTFNCNCILMSRKTFLRAGNLDPVYVHSMGDYDYGIGMKKKGFQIINSASYIGSCDDNEEKGTWRDRSLTRKERIRRKEGPKGLPRKDWYHFVRKNYGLLPALYHSITPYIRILLNK